MSYLHSSQCRAACHISLDRPVPPNREQLAGAPADPLSNLDRTQQLRTPARHDFDPAACALPPEGGPCGDNMPRFYHSGGKCLSFMYSGCAGNQNNFFTALECEVKCLRQEGIEEVLYPDTGAGAESAGRPALCELSLDEGSCAQNLVRYAYDSESDTCRQFVYGGCGGNANNFSKKSKCLKRCSRS